MRSPDKPYLLAILLIGLHPVSSGQKQTPSAAWLLPAVSWRPAKDVRLQGQVGYNHFFRMGIFYPQGFITLSKHVVLNPAYIYAVQKRPATPAAGEHYLMNAVIFQAQHKDLLIDNRNMLWNRLATGLKGRHYYRNRLRIVQSFKTWSATTRLYVYDEVFYFFNEGNIARNRPALGINCDLTKHLFADLTYIRQWDRYAGSLHLFFIACLWQF